MEHHQSASTGEGVPETPQPISSVKGHGHSSAGSGEFSCCLRPKCTAAQVTGSPECISPSSHPPSDGHASARRRTIQVNAEREIESSPDGGVDGRLSSNGRYPFSRIEFLLPSRGVGLCSSEALSAQRIAQPSAAVYLCYSKPCETLQTWFPLHPISGA